MKAFVDKIGKTHYLFLLFLVLRIIAFVFSKNYDGDAVLRASIGAAWLKDPFFVYHANPVTWVFGPLQAYLIGLALSIYDSILYSPRFVNVILGTLSFLPFYGIVRLKFDEKAAFYATLIFCFYTLHVKYSTVATSEVIFTFIILTGIYFFFRYESEKRFTWLLASAACINMAAMTRHDTPLYVVILVILLIIKNRREAFLKNMSRALLFGVLCLLFTALWYWGDYQHHGDPFHSLHLAQAEHQGGVQANIMRRGMFGNLLYNLSFWPAVIFLSLSILPALLALVGLVNAFRNRKGIDLTIFFVVPYLLYNYQATIGASLTPLARFSIAFTIFLLPFAGAGWNHIASRISRMKRQVFNYLVTATMVISFIFLAVAGVEGKGYLRDKLSSVSPLSLLPYYLEEVLDWTDNHVGSEDKVIIDSYGFQSDVIRFYSRLPKDNLKIRWQTDEEILEYVRLNQPRFIVYSSDGRLRSLFNLSPLDTLQTLQDFNFKLRFVTQHYQIYELKKAGQDMYSWQKK